VWWKKWNFDRFSAEYFSFPISGIIPQCSLFTFLSYRAGKINQLAAAVKTDWVTSYNKIEREKPASLLNLYVLARLTEELHDKKSLSFSLFCV
jgi:hypothetical protein